MASIGAFSYIKENRWISASEIRRWDWVPLAGAVSSMVSHALGVVTTLHILMGESFPTEIRSVACGITQTSYNFFHVISVKIYPWLLGM